MWRHYNLLSIVMSSVVRLPVPVSINYFWNLGSLVSLFFSVQILTSLFLTMHYTADVFSAFNSVSHIVRDVEYSWLLRYVHANSASFFLGTLYVHLSRSLFYKRYANKMAWSVSVIMLIMSMLIGFLSYVLPWGQMSYWSATVITNLVSAVPIISGDVVLWLWGSFSVDNPTLHRFYTFHFLFPFILVFFGVLHLLFIHQVSSGDPLSSETDSYKVDFWPYYGIKDMLSFSAITMVFMMVVLVFSDSLGDPDNFVMANSLITPAHIKPEWYFLFAYAILRCIPNKVSSVLALVMSVAVFLLFPLISESSFSSSLTYRIVFFLWVTDFILLTWLGSCPVEEVYLMLAQIFSVVYFSLLFVLMILVLG